MHWPWQVDREELRAAPFPEVWLRHLEENVPHYTYLTEYEQETLRGDLRIFIAEKHWEGCGGLELTDEIQVTIAAQACLLTLCLPHNFYPNVRSLFIYPAAYAGKSRRRGVAGVVTEEQVGRLGEAWHTGPVVLSWQDALTGGVNPRDGQNVVFHEFAHKLDLMDGAADGFPRLHEDGDYPRWQAVLNEQWEYLRGRSKKGRVTLLSHYGATNGAELFAVATEAFFEKPREMRQRHPELYLVLADYYRQDTAARLDAQSFRAQQREAEPTLQLTLDAGQGRSAGSDAPGSEQALTG